ncbi:alpha/beta hydrolase [Rhodococcus sp. NPDC004095]
MLEVIDKGESTDTHPAPLLFVHGAFHAAWCWEEHFLDWFAARGYRAVAVSLRGHGASATPIPLRRVTIADYVDDIAAVAADLPIHPVLVGHSMGGFVVQKYLESCNAPAAVLVSPAPGRRFFRSTLRVARRHPLLFLEATATHRPSTVHRTPKLTRESFFSDRMPGSQVHEYATRLQEESDRAIRGMIYADLVRPRPRAVPMLVLGAEGDVTHPPSEARRTAHDWGAEVAILRGSAHDMMLEPQWPEAAIRIDAWLTNRIR